MIYAWYAAVSIGIGLAAGGIVYVTTEGCISRKGRKLLRAVAAVLVAVIWFSLSYRVEARYNNGRCYECNDTYDVVPGARDEGRHLYRCPSCKTQVWY